MPPTVDLTQSLLAYDVGEEWEYQPFALGMDSSTNPQWVTEGNLDRALPPATAATTTSLPVNTYDNGLNGIGATITADGTGALTVDTIAMVAGDLLLVKNEPSANAIKNGLYIVTQAGSASEPWVLTRHGLMDAPSRFVGYVRVLLGNINRGKIFLAPPAVSAVGETLITLAEWRNQWSTTPLPPGLTLNVATGKISGAAEKAGVYVVGLRASSDSGATWSAPSNIVIGIEAADTASGVADLTPVDLEIDAGTGIVKSETTPSLVIGQHDKRLIRVRYTENNAPKDYGTLSALRIGTKEYEPEKPIYIGGGRAADPQTPPHYGSVGAGAKRVYLLYVSIGDEVKNLLADREADDGTYADLICEIEWVYANDADVGPPELVQTSQQFIVRVFRDIVRP